MKSIRTTVTTLVLGALMTTSVSHASDKKPAGPAASASGFPAAFLKTQPDLQRFADPAYYRMLAADGLREADPKALFARIAAATQANEGYKALYLSRLFTELRPDNQTGWANRARLAANLGFEAEAAAARTNAESGSATPVRGAALPGTFKVRPTSLADWAAAIAMASDDVRAREGRAVVVAVRDDLSGLSVPSNEEIQREARGPWANAKPVQLEDVLPNLFAMPQATPMDRKSMKGGLFAMGALALAGSTYATHIGAADAAAQLSQAYGNVMAHAFEVPSDFKGGSFLAVTYANGIAKSANITPKTAGKHEAIGTPVAMLWASGGSLTPTLDAVWRNGDSSKSEAIKLDAKTTKQEWKKYELKAMSYPRVQQLCAGVNQCSTPVTVLEVMLSADDLQALAPGTDARLPRLSSYAARYASRQPISVAAAGDRITGFDATGVVYITRQRPTEWLSTAAPAPVQTAKK
jgi:hypothetical protein